MSTVIELVKDGFFEDCENFEKMFLSKDGRLDTESLENMWNAFQNRKYCMKYYITHGDMMPSFGLPGKYKDRKYSESIYRTCLETGETWQEKTGYEPPAEDELW